MSQIQPATCAVEMVWHATGESALSYGTCTANALSTNNTSLRSTNGTPKCLPSSNEEKPVQSTNKPPSIAPAAAVVTDVISPFGAEFTAVTSSKTWRTPS